MTRRKRVWITVIVLAGTALLAGIAFVCSDTLVTKTVNSRVRQMIGNAGNYHIDYGSMVVLLGSRTVEIRDIVLCTDTTDSLAESTAGMSIHIKHVALRHISLRRLLQDKHLHIGRLSVDEPEIVIHRPSEKQQKQQAKLQNKNTRQQTDTTKTQSLLTGIDIGRIKIHDGKVRLSNTGNRMLLTIDDIQLAAHDIGYNMHSDSVSYNDSCYSIALKDISFTSADGLYKTTAESLTTEDAGAVVAKRVHCYNTVKKTALADKKGKVPVTWSDIRLHEVNTSPVNIIRQVLSKKINIDKIRIAGEKVNIYRDVRYKPKKPYPMPQEPLLTMKMPLRIKAVQLVMPQVDIEMATQNISSGLLQLKQVQCGISNVTNRRGDNMTANIHTMFIHGGEGDMSLTLKIDKASHFDFAANLKDMHGDTFNQFLRPLFGAEATYNIHSVKTQYSGDRRRATGTFCMVYDNMQVRIIKEDTPYKMIARNADAINLFAPVVLQKRNPRQQGKEPQSYQVAKERDEMSNFSVYLMGPILDGVLKTVLPGSIVRYIGKRAANADRQKTTQ